MQLIRYTLHFAGTSRYVGSIVEETSELERAGKLEQKQRKKYRPNDERYTEASKELFSLSGEGRSVWKQWGKTLL